MTTMLARHVCADCGAGIRNRRAVRCRHCHLAYLGGEEHTRESMQRAVAQIVELRSVRQPVEAQALDDGRCVNCGAEAWDCNSCGGLCCKCPCPWFPSSRQHYDRDGEPRRLNRRAAAALANEALADFQREPIEKGA